MTVPTIAKVVITNEAGELLLLRRSATDDRRPLQWDFPGGVVEPDEDIRAAVIRETGEEAGITLRSPMVVYGYSEPRLPHGFPTWVFFAEHITGQPDVTLSWEHDKHAWMTMQQALRDIQYPLHRQLLNYLYDNKLLDLIRR